MRFRRFRANSCRQSPAKLLMLLLPLYLDNATAAFVCRRRAGQ